MTALQISLIRFSAWTCSWTFHLFFCFSTRYSPETRNTREKLFFFLYLGNRRTPRTSRNVASCAFCVSPLPDGLAPRSSTPPLKSRPGRCHRLKKQTNSKVINRVVRITLGATLRRRKFFARSYRRVFYLL